MHGHAVSGLIPGGRAFLLLALLGTAAAAGAGAPLPPALLTNLFQLREKAEHERAVAHPFRIFAEVIDADCKAGVLLVRDASGVEIIQAIAEVRAGGAPMTSEIARMLVRSFRPPSVKPEAGLTSREAELLELLAEGLSNKEIAQKTNIAVGTVRNHLANIFQKLHVRCRTEAAAKYFRIKRQGT